MMRPATWILADPALWLTGVPMRWVPLFSRQGLLTCAARVTRASLALTGLSFCTARFHGAARLHAYQPREELYRPPPSHMKLKVRTACVQASSRQHAA
jgi:hypothetical protein